MLSKWLLDLQRRHMPLKHDPLQSAAEIHYGKIYYNLISGRLASLMRGEVVAPGEGAIASVRPTKPLSILDLGCGVGRLLLPLSLAGHELTGVEAHVDSVRRLRQNIAAASRRAEGPPQVTIIEADLSATLGQFADASFDAIMAIEVLYVNPEPERVLTEFRRILRPGGLTFVTHRPPLYYLYRALQNREFADAALVASTMRERPECTPWGGEGQLRKGMHRIYYNWQLPHRLGELYVKAGLVLEERHAIGPCSGFGPDPLSTICNPDLLSVRDREALLEIEERMGEAALETARYVLAVAQRSPLVDGGQPAPRAAA